MRHALSTLGAAKRAVRLGFGRLDARAVLMLTSLMTASAGQAETNLSSIDRFTATTASMTPSDLELRIDIREWSNESSRTAVVAALAGEPEASKGLTELPTLGYVWRSNSAVGRAVKYAHRAATPEGERITLVTDRRLDAYEFRPWAADAGSPDTQLDYAVIELYLDDSGGGTGTLSLAAEVQLDEEESLVSLSAGADTPLLLTEAKEEPEPYSANGN